MTDHSEIGRTSRIGALALFGAIVLATACTPGSDSGEGVADQITVPTRDEDTTDSIAFEAACGDDDRSWTDGADPSANHVDFVKVENNEFVSFEHNTGVLDEPDLGPVLAEVCLELSEITFTAPFDIEAGDAAYLPPGTQIREIVGADPELRVGVVVDGRVRIYEVWDRPDALAGGQLIDLGANIDEISVRVGGSDTTLVSITEPEVIEAMLGAVRSAAVDHERPPGPPAIQMEYVIEFHRSDGTTARRGYRPTSGWLEPSVLLPEEARLLLLDLIAEVDPSVVVPPPDTAITPTTAPPPVAETTTGDDDVPGLIPEPVNEAESTLRFDFGAIVGTSIVGDITWIQFDRYQLADGTNGPDLTEEVRVEGATDLPWANENARFRWYPLAPDVEVLELEADWFNRLCDGEPADITFAPSSLNRLLALDARLVSVTVIDREVVRVRDQRSC